MDPMLSEVYSSTNHLLSNYFMDNVLQDAVPPKALNLFGTKIIVKCPKQMQTLLQGRQVKRTGWQKVWSLDRIIFEMEGRK